jgi:hypothetical protein
VALVVEDGTGVDGANCYADHAFTIAYAAARGVTLADDETTDALIFVAVDYLNTLDWRGSPASPFQPNAWPRVGVWIDCNEFPESTVPQDVSNAQSQLVMQQFAGVDLFPATTGAMIIQDTVGPLTTKWSDKFGAQTTPFLPLIDALLGKWLDSGGPFTLRSIRV